MEQIQIWRDAKFIETVANIAAAWHWIHSHHSYSVAHATTFEGYELKPLPLGATHKVKAWSGNVDDETPYCGALGAEIWNCRTVYCHAVTCEACAQLIRDAAVGVQS